MTQRALLICFTGINGSGKTTRAELLVEWIASIRIKSMNVWSRGGVRTVRSILLFIGRRALGTSVRGLDSDKISHCEYQSQKSMLLGNSLVRIF